MTEKKALIGMSGGVDSSVAAHLTQLAGYECLGAMMKLYVKDGGCCSVDDAEDARAVAFRLGIPFYVFNFAEDFRTQVMDAFVSAYENGLTPNPCIQCNRHLKFDRFLHRAMELGCEKIVTGHYAQVEKDEVSGRYLLKKAADIAKDQTYFLYSLTQHQLAHTLFPLGGLTKEQVRAIAEEKEFINAKKKDSQDICFVPDGDYMAFMKEHTGKQYPAGNYVDLQGKILGQHKGAVAYTLGQRKGLGIALGQPMYVCDKDMQANTVTLGPDKALYHKALRANDWNWIAISQLAEPIRVKAKARSRMVEQSATVYPEENGFARVEFDEPQRAITPGQAVVLYDGDLVVGGGTITEVL
jgi:tRNA-specific 2-thiouridylase